MGKLVLSVFGIIFAISALGYIARIVFFPVKVLDNTIQTGYDAVDKTINAENAIYNYEWFKRQKESIDATNKKLLIAQNAVDSFKQEAGDRKDWTFEDKTEDARLRSVAQGIESQLKDMIAEYNARTKMANRNIFQDGILPDFIDSTIFIFKQ